MPPSASATSTQATADVFISYSRDDKDRVVELAQKLREAGVLIRMSNKINIRKLFVPKTVTFP